MKALVASCALLGLATLGASAQDSASPGSEDALFGAEEVTQAAPPEAAPKNDFLKYDQVRIGGSISGSVGGTASWYDPWGGSADLANPDAKTLSPSLSGRLTLVAKPAQDFGVNAQFRFSYPFASTYNFLTGKTSASGTPTATGVSAVTVPDISVFSLYSKFAYKDALFMSFGKQPIAWGVAKGFYQPADDIFAMTNVDFADTGAEREGPLAFKAMYSIPKTLANFYGYAGIPDPGMGASGARNYDFADVRYALKAEYSIGNTEAAIAGFYGYNDHPRGILMATTGTGDFNFYGEAVLKYGSERTFLEKRDSSDLLYSLMPYVAKTYDDRFFFSGTIGGYYTNSNANLTIAAQYYYNGEGQSVATAKDAFAMYAVQSAIDSLLPTSNPFLKPLNVAAKAETQFALDRIAYGVHNAGLSISKSKLFVDDLSVGLYAVSNLSDLSGMVVPSISYSLTDYSSVKLSATFSFGEDSSYYIILQQKSSGLAKPGASVSLTFTLGSGSF